MENILYSPMGTQSSGNYFDNYSSGIYEDDAFWDDLKSWARRTYRRIQTPGTRERKWTIGIGKGSMTAGGGLLGFGLAGPPGGIIGSALGGAIAHGLYPDRFMDEDEFMLEELGELAAETESDEDAVAYVRAMIPVLIRVVGGERASLYSSSPALMNVSRKMVRVLRSSRKSRPFVRLLPMVIKRSLKRIQNKSRLGRFVSPATTYNIITSQAKKVYKNPKRSARLLGRNYALCKYYRSLRKKPRSRRRLRKKW